MALRERWHRRPRAKPEPAHFAYWRWDGTQAGFDLDADSIFDELADDLLYHGDLASALRRLMADGFEDRSGRRIQGLREMLERLRERRRDLLGEPRPGRRVRRHRRGPARCGAHRAPGA